MKLHVSASKHTQTNQKWLQRMFGHVLEYFGAILLAFAFIFFMFFYYNLQLFPYAILENVDEVKNFLSLPFLLKPDI